MRVPTRFRPGLRYIPPRFSPPLFAGIRPLLPAYRRLVMGVPLWAGPMIGWLLPRVGGAPVYGKRSDTGSLRVVRRGYSSMGRFHRLLRSLERESGLAADTHTDERSLRTLILRAWSRLLYRHEDMNARFHGLSLEGLDRRHDGDPEAIQKRIDRLTEHTVRTVEKALGLEARGSLIARAIEPADLPYYQKMAYLHDPNDRNRLMESVLSLGDFVGRMRGGTIADRPRARYAKVVFSVGTGLSVRRVRRTGPPA